MRRALIFLATVAGIGGFALFVASQVASPAPIDRPVLLSRPCYRIAWIEVTPSAMPQFYDVRVGRQLYSSQPRGPNPTAEVCTPTPRELVDVEIVGRYSDGSLVPYGPRVFEYVGDFDRDGDGVYGFSDFGALAAEDSFGMASFGRFVQLFGRCIEPGGTIRRCPRPRPDPRCVPDPAVDDSLRYCRE